MVSGVLWGNGEHISPGMLTQTGWHPTLSPSSFFSLFQPHISSISTCFLFSPLNLLFSFFLNIFPLSCFSLLSHLFLFLLSNITPYLFPSFLSLPSSLSFMLCVSLLLSAIPHAGQAAPHPERLITFLPSAVCASVLPAEPIHYHPKSGVAHTSPLSATTSFSVWTPSRGRAWLLSKTSLAINQEEDRL